MTSVIVWVREEESHQALLQWLPSGTDEDLKEVVGAFYLVPEEEVGLTELKVIELVLLDERYPEKRKQQFTIVSDVEE